MPKEHEVAIGVASFARRRCEAARLAGAVGIERCLATDLRESGAIAHGWPEHKSQWALDLAG